MNVANLRRIRAKLAAGEATFGMWITLDAPSIAEMAAVLGLDWIVIDCEHGQLDWADIANHLRAVARSEVVTLVRIAELNGGLIKRALDIGADGVVIPWVETAAQLQEAVGWCLYPPEGRRGIGGERATIWGQCLIEHTRDANDQVLVVPLLETVTAMNNVQELAAVDGVQLYLIGPADLSASAGHRGQWEGPGVAEQIIRAKDSIRAAGKQVGIMATSHDDLRRRREQGFQWLALGMDAGLLMRELRASLATVGRDRTPQPDMTPGPNL